MLIAPKGDTLLRAAVFIDGGYILSQLKQHQIRPDFSGFANYFLKPLRQSVQLDLLRVYFYYCAPWMSEEPTEDEERRMIAYEEFMSEIEVLPRWEIRLGKLEKRWDRNRQYYEQKRVDVLLTVDMVRHAAAGHIQHAILIAGDSDFIPAVQATKEFGVTVSLWSGDVNTVHNDLLDLADETNTILWKKLPATKPKPPSLKKIHPKPIKKNETRNNIREPKKSNPKFVKNKSRFPNNKNTSQQEPSAPSIAGRLKSKIKKLGLLK